MSDLEGLKFHLDGLVGDDPGFSEVEWAVAEIERRWEYIDELESALSKSIMHQKELDRCVHITHDQIDAAWGEGRPPNCDFEEGFLAAFAVLGIHCCKGCGGSGAVVVDRDPDGRPYLDKCPACNGHGWVIGGEGE